MGVVSSKVWEREIDIYGKVKKGDSIFVPFLYQGQYFDNETELAYNRFRYYSHESGTYISQDPIGLAGSNPNFYAYVKNSTVRIDPFGLIDSQDILFSQDSISENLSKGKNIPRSGESVWDLIAESAKKGSLADVLELNITTYNYPNGRVEYVTLNNRTLFIAQQSGVDIKPNLVSNVTAQNKLDKLLDGKFPLENPDDLIVGCKHKS